MNFLNLVVVDQIVKSWMRQKNHCASFKVEVEVEKFEDAGGERVKCQKYFFCINSFIFIKLKQFTLVL